MKTPTESELKTARLVINKLLYWGLSENIDYWKFSDWTYEYSDKLNDAGIRPCNGETKICFISDALENWVIKTSISDEYHETDFCLIEYNNYTVAAERRLSRYFAAMYDLGNGFYLQERTHVDEDENDDEFFNYVSSCLNRAEYEDEDDYTMAVSDGIYEMNDEDRIHAMLGYSNKIEELIGFCNSHKINDLHNGNWGLTDRGYVMIDYSGYN